jgi:hypothetical protein
MATVRHLGLFPSQQFLAGFMPCVADVSLASLQNLSRYPDIWMPSEDITAMYWRVKKWRYSFNGDWSYTLTGLGQSFNIFHTNSNSSEFSVGQLTVTLVEGVPNYRVSVIRPAESGTYGEIPTSETKLICGPQSFTYPAFDEDEDGNLIIVDVEDKHHFTFGYEDEGIENNFGVVELPDENIEITARSAFSYDASYISGRGAFSTLRRAIPAFYRNAFTGGREYILALMFSANLSAGSGRYFLYGQALGLSSEMDAGTFTYKFLGKTYTAPIVARPITFGSSRTPVNVSAQFTLEATEYWPYDPGDGLGPIYDSVTGAQLREFPA